MRIDAVFGGIGRFAARFRWFVVRADSAEPAPAGDPAAETRQPDRRP
jgi:hypothetical protein